MNFASVASQLREAQDGPGGLTTAGLALQAGAQRARGAPQAIAGHAQARRADLLSSNPVPSDGSRCEGCGEYFGILRRRQICGSCDRYFCASCLGAFTVAGIGCFCGSRCAQCRELGQKSGEFETIRTTMEDGVSVTISFPPKASMFGSSGRRKVPAWLSLKTDLVWASLEQRAGQPLEQGQLPLAEVLHVRNTGMHLELSVKGQSQPTHLDFGTAEERINWERYLNLAAEVLVPESERADRETAKAAFRAQEIEERRALNEERKKNLSQGLGMRYTAEAAMAGSGSETGRGYSKLKSWPDIWPKCLTISQQTAIFSSTFISFCPQRFINVS